MKGKRGVTVEVAVQTSLESSRDYVSPQVSASQPSSDVAWLLQRPHTVSVLCLCLGGLWIAAQTAEISALSASTRDNVTSGVFAALLMFLVFAVLQFPDGILVRPCKEFWRFVTGVSVLYLLLLTFLLFQELNDVRRGLAYIDPKLGQALPEKNYAEDCAFSLGAVLAQVDVFVSAHFFGWLVKALVIRDLRLLWFLSILFEWMEISLRHILPNFWECWWDHILLDILGCNLLGIVAGLQLCKWFRMKEYTWQVGGSLMDGELKSPIETRVGSCAVPGDADERQTESRRNNSVSSLREGHPDTAPATDKTLSCVAQDGDSVSARRRSLSALLTSSDNVLMDPSGATGQPSGGSKTDDGHCKVEAVLECSLKRTASVPQFPNWTNPVWKRLTPYRWTEYKWPPFLSNYQTFLSLLFFSVGVTLLDLNLFFLKAELWLEPDHWISSVRTFFWGAAAASGTREFYEFVTDRNCKRMGLQCWLDLALVSTELLLAIKWRDGLPPHGPMPSRIVMAWVAITVVIVGVTGWLFFFPRPPRESNGPDFWSAKRQTNEYVKHCE